MAVDTRRQPRIPLEELCRLPTFFNPVVSWKGDRVAFYWDKTGRNELFVVEPRTYSRVSAAREFDQAGAGRSRQSPIEPDASRS